MRVENTILPEALHEGDKIAIIAPATVCKSEYIDGAADFLRREGFEPVLMPHVKGPADGTYASSLADRLADFRAAWSDSEVKCVLCARGGYGCNHLIPHLSPEFLRANPKWLIGFSDVSALHAMLLHAGIASIHGPMAKHLATEPEQYCTRAMMRILREGPVTEYFAAPDPRNTCGEAEGHLVGGNLAVLNGLAATPYDIFEIPEGEDRILFIEDIAEPIYKVERVLRRLAMAGQLQGLRALILGHFTEYNPDKNHSSVEEMTERLYREMPEAFPPVLAFGLPVGHTSDNVPLVESARVHLSVTREGTLLAPLS